MTHKLDPKPSGSTRARQNQRIRREAAGLSPVPVMPAIDNGETLAYQPQSPTTFTKGLKHDEWGVVADDHLPRFISWLNQRRVPPTAFSMPDPTGQDVKVAVNGDLLQQTNPHGQPYKMRRWESPLSGHAFDLEGSDPGALDIPPAPGLGSGELAAEMAEVYALALLRDQPFGRLHQRSSALSALRRLRWFRQADEDPAAERRRQGRLTPTGVAWFRGSARGAKVGPYLSQFLLAGSPSFDDNGDLNGRRDGKVAFGRNYINLRVAPHPGVGDIPQNHPDRPQLLERVDHMRTWPDWLDVQQGADRKGEELPDAKERFLATPRDLATYVHFDALYQAYLNATLFLGSWMMDGPNGPRVEVDRGLPEGPVHAAPATRRLRDGFATFGMPHVLSLLTEVASRALKVVRRQKYNIHLRARPEVLAARLCLVANGEEGRLGAASVDAQTLYARLDGAVGYDGSILDLIARANPALGGPFGPASRNLLLPMAYAEGSPMHPAYGAGHATVAGACVTIIKAFFELYESPSDDVGEVWTERLFTSIYAGTDLQLVEPTASGAKVKDWAPPPGERVTILGELDKLAANISIGRNMAGVHYYSDYYESLRLGETLAISVLREQMLTYPEPVSMRLTTFDSEQVRIVGEGDGQTVEIQRGSP